MFCVRQSTNIFLKLLYLSLCVYLDKYHEVLFKKKKKQRAYLSIMMIKYLNHDYNFQQKILKNRTQLNYNTTDFFC